MTTQPELFATALAAVRALRISLIEWMDAHWRLRDSARNMVIADFERMLGELDAAWSLLTPIHGPALVIHRLLTKHLETRFAPPGHPAGRDIVMPILAGKAGPRFTERENHNLVMAFDIIERELLKLAGEPAAVPEQTRELPAVNAEVDAPVAAAVVPDPKEATPKTPGKWLGPALILLRDNPTWSLRKIAREVGVHHSQLSRSPQYRRATELACAEPPPTGFYEKSSDTGNFDRLDAVFPDDNE